MTYDTIARIAQHWGLFYFLTLFVGVLIYVLLPRNQSIFKEAAHAPLNEDE